MDNLISVEQAIEDYRHAESGRGPMDMVVRYGLHMGEDGRLVGDYGHTVLPPKTVEKDRAWIDEHEEEMVSRLTFLEGEEHRELSDEELDGIISEFLLGVRNDDIICNSVALKHFPGVLSWIKANKTRVIDRVRAIEAQADAAREAREAEAAGRTRPELPPYGRLYAVVDLDDTQTVGGAARLFADVRDSDARKCNTIQIVDGRGQWCAPYSVGLIDEGWDPDAEDYRLQLSGLRPVGPVERDGSLLKGEVVSTHWEHNMAEGCVTLKGGDRDELIEAERIRAAVVAEVDERAGWRAEWGWAMPYAQAEDARAGVRRIDDASWWCELGRHGRDLGEIVYSIFAR